MRFLDRNSNKGESMVDLETFSSITRTYLRIRREEYKKKQELLKKIKTMEEAS